MTPARASMRLSRRRPAGRRFRTAGSRFWRPAAARPRGRSRAPAVAPVPGGAPALPPGVYSLFEERFRGPAEEVARSSAFTSRFSRGCRDRFSTWGAVAVNSCGFFGERGSRRRDSRSIRSPSATVAPTGSTSPKGTASPHLASSPAASLGAVTAFQVVEHWSPETLFAFLREARRVLAPGGLLALETINTDSLSAWRAFYLDPSHVRPVPPEALKFLAESAGFVDARLEYLAPLPPEARLEETTANDARLNRLLFGPQDYALLARAPGPAA